MRSKLHVDYLDASLSREGLVGGPPWFGELERCPHWFWYRSLTPVLYLHAFHIHRFIACHVLLFIMPMPCLLE